MLRYLTHKLKTQSLNEADSYPSKNDDDHDSGTESDDEGADAEELEKYMDDSLQCDVSSAPSDRASSTLDTITEGQSPCPLDSALPSDADHHSSEEELEVINSSSSALPKYPEKRKWSRLSLGSSSDEEVRDLMCASAPVEFRASPPAHVPKPSRSLSPPPKLFHAAIPPHELCSVSPRKRHRRLLAPTAASTNEQRPSLDFEKMQQDPPPISLDDDWTSKTCLQTADSSTEVPSTTVVLSAATPGGHKDSTVYTSTKKNQSQHSLSNTEPQHGDSQPLGCTKK